jgi:hypothetical protein
MDTSDFCLAASDLVCIEHMLGHTLPERIKAYLIGAFGAGSDYQEMRLWVQEKQKACDDCCDECYACAFDPGDDLLTRVFRIVSCYERGVFDTSKNSYADACKELGFNWHYYKNMESLF